jgi:hypothetical protein
MKKALLIFGIMFLMPSCANTFYRISTEFYELHRGMTKEQFTKWLKPSFDDKNGSPVMGGRPSTTKTFKYGEDVWEVWVFEVYGRQNLYNVYGGQVGYHLVFDHFEYVAFKNDIVEEWGTGVLPITIRENANQIDINVRKY